MKTLIIAAHLDDETFGLGGTLLKMAKENQYSFKVLVICNGRDEKNSQERLTSFLEIINQLNCEYRILDFKDLSLDKVSFQDIVSPILEEINNFCPERVFSTHEDDLHRDHRIVAEAVKVACRPQEHCSVKELYQYKIPAASHWNFKETKFNVAFDITETIEDKLILCSKYKTEVKSDRSNGPLSLHGIKAINAADGVVFGYKYAEVATLIYKR